MGKMKYDICDKILCENIDAIIEEPRWAIFLSWRNPKNWFMGNAAVIMLKPLLRRMQFCVEVILLCYIILYILFVFYINIKY